MLVDVFSKGITGKVAEAALGKAGITVNKNAIPFDKNPPMVASGIRVGTPAVTTRGMGEPEMDRVAELIARALAAPDDEAALGGGQGRRRGAVPRVPALPRSSASTRSTHSTPSGRVPPITPARSRCSRRRRYANFCRTERGRLDSRARDDDVLSSAMGPDDRRLAARVDAVFARRRPARAIAAAVRAARRASGRWRRPSPTSLERGGVLLAEAGTGTGKTLAYLVPAILSGQRVLVSTGTKNLQEQIFSKDLPLLAAVLPRPLHRHLHEGPRQLPLPASLRAVPPSARRCAQPLDRVHLTLIEEWARATTTGDRAEIDELPDDLPFWSEIAATTENCLGSDCPQYGDCFVTRMRQRAAESDVVIVNHHLLCADAAVRHQAFGEVIPDCPALVVDEAHQLEDVATQYFGVAVSNYRLEELVQDGERVAAPGRRPRRRAGRGDPARSLRTHAAAQRLLRGDRRAGRPRRPRRRRPSPSGPTCGDDRAQDRGGAGA